MKNKLTPQEITFIEERERGLSFSLKELEKARLFKVDDYLIAFRKEYYDNKVYQVKNSYGAPKKYQVIHVDGNGIPYIKELNKKGKPIGQLLCPIELHNDSEYLIRQTDLTFEVDPDYTDSIIMMDEENYDSSHIHRTKSETFKEITEHNKKYRVSMSEPKEIADWFSTIKVGDVLYRSIKTSFTVLEIFPVPLDAKGRTRSDQKFVKIQDSKGKIKELAIRDFMWRSLYTVQPRSYNELKDPK